ncbi:unnamed protein product [Hydatigera taeniaeformis]|uniref:G_PROTEIN_RECEP_F2_4 domain-containing protein n=1 Tax=Hydatigena taeniaeformis TaxID=6205 RepID=A0A0R3WM55_HYDTA|nr:unnamed protein product [Hydatigera taeniaeformis]
MLIVVTHVTLLLVPQVWGETMAPGKSDGRREFGLIFSRNNAGASGAESYALADSMLECIGVVRGLLVTAGIHLEPRVRAIGRCPPGAPSTLITLCSTDIPVFPSEVGTVEELQNQLLSKLKTEHRPNLGLHLNLAIRKVSPVVDTSSGIIYANTYCAQCHNISSSKRVKRLPKQLLCTLQNGITKCFVKAEMPESASFCDPDTQILRAFFTWDSIFTLPDEDEANTEKSWTRTVLELFQWICCSFSMLTLVIAICVFSTSARLRRPLPGKMMIALCCTLLGALVAFLLASGAMDLFIVPLRPMCVTFASLLQFLLLAAFVWMAIFAVELFRTFGLTRMFRHAFLCYCCRRVRERKTKAMRKSWFYQPTKAQFTQREMDLNAIFHHGFALELNFMLPFDGVSFQQLNEYAVELEDMMLRARGSDPNPSRRFKRQVLVASMLPFCFIIPTLIINEYVHLCLKSLNETSASSNWSLSFQESKLGSVLHRLNPGFCPANDPNYAWFKGHYVGLLVWFLIPAGITICFNLFALIIVCIQICRLKREARLSPGTASPQFDGHMKPSKSIIAVCTKLAVILGASWFIQLLAGICPHLQVLRQLAGLANSAQGGIIAVSMLASSKARRVMAQRLPSKCCEALGVSQPSSRCTQEMTTSSKSRSRLTGQPNSQTTSLIQNAAS